MGAACTWQSVTDPLKSTVLPYFAHCSSWSHNTIIMTFILPHLIHKEHGCKNSVCIFSSLYLFSAGISYYIGPVIIQHLVNTNCKPHLLFGSEVILHSCCIIVSTVGWTWWDWSLILWTYLSSVLWHCWLGHLTRKNPSPIWPIMCLVGRQTLLNQSEVIAWNNSELSNIAYAFNSVMCIGSTMLASSHCLLCGQTDICNDIVRRRHQFLSKCN